MIATAPASGPRPLPGLPEYNEPRRYRTILLFGAPGSGKGTLRRSSGPSKRLTPIPSVVPVPDAPLARSAASIASRRSCRWEFSSAPDLPVIFVSFS